MSGNGNGTKAAVAAEIQAEAEDWHAWQVTLAQQAQAAQQEHSWCSDGLSQVADVSGLTYRQLRGDADIPVETADLNPEYYTVQGLRDLVLESNRARHGQVKQDVRKFILGTGFAQGHISEAELATAFEALGLDLPKSQTRYDMRGYFSWFEDGAGATDAASIERRILEAIRGLLPEGSAVNERSTGEYSSGGYVPEVRIIKSTERMFS